MTPPTLVPPRPNLGPEPWPESGLPWIWITALAIATAMVVAWIWWRLRRRPGAVGAASTLPSHAIPASNPNPEGVVALAETARAALVSRFGSPWRARTTEEVATDPGLAETFGPETVERLVSLLRAADRSKFAADGSGPQRDEDTEAWALWVASFVAAAGARSMIKGK